MTLVALHEAGHAVVAELSCARSRPNNHSMRSARAALLELRATAYHEAAHAVIDEALGIRVRLASIAPNGDSSGRVLCDAADASAAALLVACLAGHEAEDRAAPAGHLASSHGKRPVDDDPQSRRLALNVRDATGAHPTRVLNRAREVARQMVTELWPVIEHVAGALTQQGTLTGAQVRREITHAKETMRPPWQLGSHHDTTPAGRRQRLAEITADSKPKAKPRRSTARGPREGPPPPRDPMKPIRGRGYVATKTATVLYYGEPCPIIAGVTGVSHDCTLVHDYPQYFEEVV